ncbi:hypothetical protein ABT346_22145 [Micromonospora peucetia]|uniref:hypothetical protein n=1 Tax=Micromonospora peucetia TaxID=47871 RepID=UPI00332423E2
MAGPGSRVRQAGITARRIAGVFGEPLQGGDELGTLVRFQRGENFLLVLVGDAACAG